MTLAMLFEQELDLARAAAESGLPTEEFATRIRRSPDIGRSLGVLLLGGTVTRGAFKTIFPAMKVNLRLDKLAKRDSNSLASRPVRITPIEGGPEFVLIPPGTFVMGTGRLISEDETDQTPHEVEITKPFYLAINDLTPDELKALVPEKYDSPEYTRKWLNRITFKGEYVLHETPLHP